MISFLFFFLWAVWIVVPVYLTMDLMIVWPILAALLGVVFGFAVNFALFALSLHVYGVIHQKNVHKNARHHKVLDGFLILALRLLRFRIHATGLENIPKDRPFIFVANHQSNYDTMIHKVLLTNPFVFIAKESIFTWKIIGPMARLVGNIPMHRESDRDAAKALLEGVKVYQSGVSVGIYPEGTRSKKNSLIEFKPGALKLAIRPGAPVLVGTIYNTIYAWKGWPFKGLDVYVHYHPVLEGDVVKTMNSTELTHQIKATIQAQLDEFAKKEVTT